MRRLFFSFALLTVALSSRGARAEFPKDWLGIWTGTYESRQNGHIDKGRFSLRIQKIPHSTALLWVVKRGNELARNYELSLADDVPGHYTLDDGDGTKFDYYLEGDTFYSLYEQNNKINWVSITRTPEGLTQMGTVHDLQSYKVSGEPGNPTLSYKLQSCQQVLLLQKP
jgi:hypothetical protein